VSLFPSNGPEKVHCVDVAVGSDGSGGVELARRGFRVTGIEANPKYLRRTFAYAQEVDAPIELLTAKVEEHVLSDSSADLVTVLHGLHLLDLDKALHECWRILKPNGLLVCAWNDRDLGSDMVCAIEDIVEKHIPSYNRYQMQHSVEDWLTKLENGGLFKMVAYRVERNPMKMESVSSLLDIIDSMSFVRSNLRGEGRKKFNNDLGAMIRHMYGGSRFDLPLETKVFILRKLNDCHKMPHQDKRSHHKTLFST